MRAGHCSWPCAAHHTTLMAEANNLSGAAVRHYLASRREVP